MSPVYHFLGIAQQMKCFWKLREQKVYFDAKIHHIFAHQMLNFHGDIDLHQNDLTFSSTPYNFFLRNLFFTTISNDHIQQE